MSTAADIKTQIKTYLDDLVTAGTLAAAISDDFKRGIFDRDFTAYPVAILQTAAIECSIKTGVHDERNYEFEIIVVSKGDDVASVTQVEDLQEAMLDKFAAAPTLNNTCQKSIPSSSAPQPFMSRGSNYIVFKFVIQAQKLKLLTFV